MWSAATQFDFDLSKVAIEVCCGEFETINRDWVQPVSGMHTETKSWQMSEVSNMDSKTIRSDQIKIGFGICDVWHFKFQNNPFWLYVDQNIIWNMWILFFFSENSGTTNSDNPRNWTRAVIGALGTPSPGGQPYFSTHKYNCGFNVRRLFVKKDFMKWQNDGIRMLVDHNRKIGTSLST